MVDAEPPAAVAGGNVETSQRIVDTILRALAQAAPDRIPAASAGTMSNLTIGGVDARTRLPFTYYETIAGGMGAGPFRDGTSGVHTHMTNSLNTPVEALEFAYPLRVKRYCYRSGSGGSGTFRGGVGLIREFELLSDSQVTLLADRQKSAPYGLGGGSAGSTGSSDGAASRRIGLKSIGCKVQSISSGRHDASNRDAGRRWMGSWLLDERSRASEQTSHSSVNMTGE